MLFAMMILVAIVVLLASSLDYSSSYQFSPSWLPIYTLVGACFDLMFLIGIWFWKKIAVYAYVLSQVVGILIEALVFKPEASMVDEAALGLFIIGLTLFAVNRKWQYFE